MFKKVMYPIDVQEGAMCQAAISDVLKQVKAWGAELYLVYVLPGFGMPIVASFFPEGAEDAARAEGRKRLEEFVKKNIPQDMHVKASLVEGTAYEEILSRAEAEDVDVIIVPSHDRSGVERWLLGSTASKVVEHAKCSVLVLRNCETD